MAIAKESTAPHTSFKPKPWIRGVLIYICSYFLFGRIHVQTIIGTSFMPIQTGFQKFFLCIGSGNKHTPDGIAAKSLPFAPPFFPSIIVVRILWNEDTSPTCKEKYPWEAMSNFSSSRRISVHGICCAKIHCWGSSLTLTWMLLTAEAQQVAQHLLICFHMIC